MADTVEANRFVGALRLGLRDRQVMAVWLATRLSVFVAGWFASWALAGPPLLLQGPDIQVGSPLSFPELWNRWDAMHYQSIAGPGYGSPNFETNYAFFPGFPLAMRLVALTGLDLTVSGLIVAFLAGLAAALALGRLTEDVGGRPELGVLAWAIAPAAVYLAAPFSEALFCAFAFWAWVMVRRGAWVLGGRPGHPRLTDPHQRAVPGGRDRGGLRHFT